MRWPAADAYRTWLDNAVADWRWWAALYRNPALLENAIEVPDPLASAARLEHLADQLERIAVDSCVGVVVTLQRAVDGRLLDPRVPQRGKKKAPVTAPEAV